jgi:hypothetical protein
MPLFSKFAKSQAINIEDNMTWTPKAYGTFSGAMVRVFENEGRPTGRRALGD